MDVIVHQPLLKAFVESEWTLDSLDLLEALLHEKGTLEFKAVETGLYPAAVADDYTGYSNIWIRDNIHLGNSFLELGEPERAVGIVAAMTRFLLTQQHRIEKLIAGEVDRTDPHNRPHIRFNGTSLTENPEKWAHSQNDALGYYLWLTSEVMLNHAYRPDARERELIALFPALFEAIRFWEDEDSGHWEETRKIEASSIGAVTRGLQLFQRVLESNGPASFANTEELKSKTEEMISRGMQALAKILPWECRQEDPLQRRRYDAALLFLICPLGLLEPSDTQSLQIVTDVIENLQGPIGIRRYNGDSYWCANYKQLLDEESRTTDYSETTSKRDELLRPGEEAEWCIFDPILSTIFGRRFVENGSDTDRKAQVLYLNRSLGQITGEGPDWPEFRCPESYFLSDGVRIPNDVTPLLWTQANLRLALRQMRITLQQS